MHSSLGDRVRVHLRKKKKKKKKKRNPYHTGGDEGSEGMRDSPAVMLLVNIGA